MLAALGLGKVPVKKRDTGEVKRYKKIRRTCRLEITQRVCSLRLCAFCPLQSARTAPCPPSPTPSSSSQPLGVKDSMSPRGTAVENNAVLALEEVFAVWFQPSERRVYLIQVISQSNFAGDQFMGEVIVLLFQPHAGLLESPVLPLQGKSDSQRRALAPGRASRDQGDRGWGGGTSSDNNGNLRRWRKEKARVAQGGRTAVWETTVSEASGASAPLCPVTLATVPPRLFRKGFIIKHVPLKAKAPNASPVLWRFRLHPKHRHRPSSVRKVHKSCPWPQGKRHNTERGKWGETARYFFTLFFRYQSSNSWNILN